MPIVLVQPDGQLGGSVGGVRIGLGVGPFAQRGLDEALGLAVCLGRIGLGPDVLEAVLAAGFADGVWAIAGAVGGHDPCDGDAEARIGGKGGFEEGDGAFLALVGQDPGEGDAGGVIEGDMDELPAGAAGPALPAVGGDTVALTLEAAELLDVDVDELARLRALVAANRLGRLERRETVEAKPLEDAADGGGRDPGLNRDLLAGP